MGTILVLMAIAIPAASIALAAYSFGYFGIRWVDISRRFPGRRSMGGRKFLLQTGVVADITYGKCLTITTNDQGVLLDRVFPMPFPNASIFIPWNAIRNARTYQALLAERVIFDLDCPPVTTIELPRKIFAGHEVRISWDPSDGNPPPIPRSWTP
ncbi:MAG TPA: hypothetical protein VMF06_12080 [Candidatus Limnocylindria bacterium]|jgi:hypothetical protein|nr:hypothetical protein [Candidatus Limnocylindria bacterium]